MKNSQLNLAELESMHSAIVAKYEDDFDRFDELGLSGAYRSGCIKAREAIRACKFGTYHVQNYIPIENLNGFWNVMRYSLMNLAYARYSGERPVQYMLRLAYMRGFINEVRMDLAVSRLLDAI